MPARVVEARNALRDRIAAWWAPAAPDAVTTPWRLDIRLDDLAGRQVYVFPESYLGVNATRGQSRSDYAYVLVAAEKYPDPGDPTDDWVDERVAWCEALFNHLGDTDVRLLPTEGEPYSGLWPEETAVTAVYDLEELSERKLFLSTLGVTYREIV